MALRSEAQQAAANRPSLVSRRLKPYFSVLAGLILTYISLVPLIYIHGSANADTTYRPRSSLNNGHVADELVQGIGVKSTPVIKIDLIAPTDELRSTPTINAVEVVATLVIYSVSVTALCIAAAVAARQMTAQIEALKEFADRLWTDDEPREELAWCPEFKTSEAFASMYDAVNSRLDRRLKLLTSFAHDARTPIARLRYRASNVPPSVQEQKLLLDILETEQLMNEGIAYASGGHITSEEFQSLEIEPFVRQIVEGYTDTGRNVSLIASTGGRIAIRKTAMKRVIGNFIDNGLKFAGSVEVRASRFPSGEVSIAVLDRGPGVDDDELEMVLKPFVRSKNRNSDVPGIGLGLAIAHQLARTSNARIKLQNRLGGGLIAAVLIAPVNSSDCPAPPESASWVATTDDRSLDAGGLHHPA